MFYYDFTLLQNDFQCRCEIAPRHSDRGAYIQINLKGKTRGIKRGGREREGAKMKLCTLAHLDWLGVCVCTVPYHHSVHMSLFVFI